MRRCCRCSIDRPEEELWMCYDCLKELEDNLMHAEERIMNLEKEITFKNTEISELNNQK